MEIKNHTLNHITILENKIKCLENDLFNSNRMLELAKKESSRILVLESELENLRRG
jgi:hypothetical protein